MSATYHIEKPEILSRIPISEDSLIEASAGTGKTFTLEHLVVELLLSRKQLELDDILIVTFTERATSELSTRIRSKIESLLSAHDSQQSCPDKPHWAVDEQKREKLQRTLYSFDRASIYTIHGFCHRALAENPFYANRLFEEELIGTEKLIRKAYKRGLRERIANEKDFGPYLSAWIDQSREPFEDMVRLLTNVFGINAPLRPTFNEQRALKYLDKIANREPVGALKAELDATDIHGQTAKTICDRVENLQSRLKSAPNQDRERIRILLDWLPSTKSQGNYHYLMRKLSGQSLDGGFIRDLTSLIEAVSPVKTAIVQTFKPIVEDYMDQIQNEEGLFSYDDMLEMVRKNLQNQRFKNILQNQYIFALIDEFQDTDPVQWDIFRRLFFDSDTHTIHLIGDPKQAIYSFRNADIYTYFGAKQKLKETGHKVTRLEHNYRANQSLIEAFNLIFNSDDQSGFFTGANKRGRPLRCGNPEWETKDYTGSNVTPCHLVKYTQNSEKTKVADLRESFAKDFAYRIDRILSHESLQFFRDSGDGRNVEPNDIFVLTRRKRESDRIAKYLERRQIPYNFYKQDGLFDTRHAAEILDLLSAIQHPDNWSNTVKAALTPFWEANLSNVPPERHKSSQNLTYDYLKRWNEQAKHGNFSGLFESILSETNVVKREILLDRDPQRIPNYRDIFEYLQEYAAEQSLDFPRLVGHLRELVHGETEPESEHADQQRMITEDPAVQIMTIHKSKGLEAEIVFVLGGFTFGSGQYPTHFHNQNGQRVQYLEKPGAANKKRLVKEQREENQRLLYVALTRAKSQIYLPYYTENIYQPGLYKPLFRRLEQYIDTEGNTSDSELVDIETINLDPPDLKSERSDEPTWPIPSELEASGPNLGRLSKLRAKNVQKLTSYSQLQTHDKINEVTPSELLLAGEIDEIEKRDLSLHEDPLEPGTETGLFIHQLFEDFDFEKLEATATFEEWLRDAEVAKVLDKRASQFDISKDGKKKAAKLIYRTLTTRLRTRHSRDISPISSIENIAREPEFLLPIPEQNHPKIFEDLDEKLEIERGYIRGFIDILFKHDGRLYFGDWKSNLLEDYDSERLCDIVEDKYRTQLALYSLATIRTAKIRSKKEYEQKFGGAFYFFVRGLEAPTDSGQKGVFYEKLSWRELENLYDRMARSELEAVFQ